MYFDFGSYGPRSEHQILSCAAQSQIAEGKVTPHLAQKKHSAMNGRTSKRPGYAVNQQERKRIQEIFGWLKAAAMLRKTRRAVCCVSDLVFTFAAAAYSLVRMRNLAHCPRRAPEE